MIGALFQLAIVAVIAWAFVSTIRRDRRRKRGERSRGWDWDGGDDGGDSSDGGGDGGGD